MTKDLPSPELLRKLLRYEPDTGKLFWRHREGAPQRWNSRYVGKQALATISSSGYPHGQILRNDLLAHRVIWAIQNGSWPIDEIDHINGDVCDNRIENLREATGPQNKRNRGIQKNNTSGFKGVYWCKKKEEWYASIRYEKKYSHLGYHDTREKAHQAYCVACEDLHGEFARVK